MCGLRWIIGLHDAHIIKQGTTLSPNLGSSGNCCVVPNLLGADGMRGITIIREGVVYACVVHVGLGWTDPTPQNFALW